LGIGKVKGQLEDLSFPYVYPSQYKKTKNKAKPHYAKAEDHIKKMRRVLLRRLAEENLKAEIHGRKKHLYSLWRKLERKEIAWDFEKVHDIVALRILVNTISQCYTALGVVHSVYKPVPHIGISDFIAQPKPNGYRSIHTKVFGPGERIVEIQIRTHEMHEQAEYGVAAHWAYSEAKAKGEKDEVLETKGTEIEEQKLSWVKQLVDWQKEITDSKEFLQAVKFDALGHRNFIFSPKGDVYDLPSEATPVDFAYAVHTDLGSYIKGAKVDGKMVPLDFKLKSGHVVEIIKSKTKRAPSHEWLDFVVTTLAKREIKKALRREQEKE
jgi:GTP pyrophosphokinase